MLDPLNLNIFDSDEDEIMEEVVLRRHPKVFKNRVNYLEEYDEFEFFKRFRIQKQTFTILCDTIAYRIQSTTERNNAISPETKLFLTLRFYATGSMLIAVADYAGVSKISACYIVTKVTEPIAALSGRYIKFPETVAEKQLLKETFYTIARFPHVIGAIDCTHVRINSPGGNKAERYRNRKGYFSWNVQVICDGQLKINNIVTRWPGSTHDQTIFNNSIIKGVLDNYEFGSAIVLGDSGYGNSNYVITPLDHPHTRAEILFNESHIRTRTCVERCFGVWKRRFPILSMGMRVSQQHSQAIIVTTAVVHKIALAEHEGEPPNDIELENIPDN